MGVGSSLIAVSSLILSSAMFVFFFRYNKTRYNIDNIKYKKIYNIEQFVIAYFKLLKDLFKGSFLPAFLSFWYEISFISQIDGISPFIKFVFVNQVSVKC